MNTKREKNDSGKDKAGTEQAAERKEVRRWLGSPWTIIQVTTGPPKPLVNLPCSGGMGCLCVLVCTCICICLLYYLLWRNGECMSAYTCVHVCPSLQVHAGICVCLLYYLVQRPCFTVQLTQVGKTVSETQDPEARWTMGSGYINDRALSCLNWEKPGGSISLCLSLRVKVGP